MSKEIRFRVARDTFMGGSDRALVSEGEDPLEEIAASAIDMISTELEITVGDVTMHLAAFLNPAHWEDDWEKAGVENVYEWAAAL